MKKSIFYVSIVVFLLVNSYLLYKIATIPYLGIHVNESVHSSVTISSVEDTGWGNVAGLQPGQIISEINGNAAILYPLVKRYGLIEQASTIKLSGGKLLVVDKEITTKKAFYHLIFPIIFLIVCSIISIYLSKQDNNLTSYFLSTFFLILALGYISAGASSRGVTLGRLISGLTLLSSPIIFIQIMIHQFFGVKWKGISIRVILFLYLLVAFISLMELLSITFSMYYDILLNVQVGVFLAIFFYVLVIAWMNYQNNKMSNYGITMKIMIQSLLFAVSPFVFLYLLPLLTLGRPIITSELSMVFLFILPITYMYLFQSRQVLDLDYYIQRIKYYTVWSILPNTILLAFLLNIKSMKLTILELLQIELGSYCILVLFLTVKETWEKGDRDFFFNQNISYQASLMRFSQNSKEVFKPKEILLLINKEAQYIFKSSTCTYVDVSKTTKMICNYNQTNNAVNQIIRKAISGKKIQLGSILQVSGSVIVVIADYKETWTILFLTHQKGTVLINPNETQWLKGIAYLANNLLEYSKIMELEIEKINYSSNVQTTTLNENKMFFAILEKVRADLAKDLHDSVLQEHIFLKRSVDEMLKENEHEKLNLLQEKILDCIYIIRETCNELRPPFLHEMGLQKSLDTLVERMRLNGNFSINLSNNVTQQLLFDEQIAIYRITQELLMNAVKHSKADYVTIIIECDEQILHYKYKDDGIGLKTNEKIDISIHMGIASIRERIRYLDGKFNLTSKEKDGLEIEFSFHIQSNLDYLEVTSSDWSEQNDSNFSSR